MTPLQFVREECANHQPDGSCTGVGVFPFEKMDAKPRCLVSQSNRCLYFEECVAPMADMVSDPRRAAALQGALAEYRRMTKQAEAQTRRCPDCGGPCQTRKRYCPTCALKRRKMSTRRAVSRLRMSCKQLSPKTDEKPQ